MIKNFKKLIEKSQNIVITTHLHPDADGIGSEIALCLALRKLGKTVVCVNEIELMDRYTYLDPHKVVISYNSFKKSWSKKHLKANEEIDLFIVVDTNTLSRVGTNAESILNQSKELLFIDHHPCPHELLAIHCIDINMAATGELVGSLIESLGIELDRDMGLALYTSILIDTSSFRYPTVSANTHKLIAKLLETGISPSEAYTQMYGAKNLSYMRLLGTVLSSTQSTKNNDIAWFTLSDDDLAKKDIDPEDTLGFINHLLILDRIKVACMFRQIGSKVKISLRSTGEFDVGVMAQALGGGGHNHSAATMVEGALSEVVPATIEKIQLMLKKT